MKYDIVIIGSGPGGYVGAIRCAQLGFKTAVIEKYDKLGGTCLNVGCIPSKALLDSSEHYFNARSNFSQHGIGITGLKLHFSKMMERKNTVVDQTVEGVRYLMKKNKIDVYNGTASFKDPNHILIHLNQGKKQVVEATGFIIATGSKPGTLPHVKIDGKRVITSTEALNLKKVPKHLVVIGGGVIGVELGSVYARLGAEVSIVEYFDSLLPGMDKTLGRELKRALRKLSIRFYLSHEVTGVSAGRNTVSVEANDKNGRKIKINGDICLMATGRIPYTENLGLDNAGIKVNQKGQIEVNDELRTNVSHIYAIGDVVRGPMLAHKAEEEGIFVAERLAGLKPHIHYHLIPSVVYTWPEVAAVGYTEEQLIERGISFKSGSFPFRASGRARVSMDTEGLIKALADKETDELLGVHMIGARAADMIAEAVVAMEFRASAEDIARTSHAHPTFTEAFREACLAATEDRAIHI
jgi:dihydrolipoamide dehydrogenase